MPTRRPSKSAANAPPARLNRATRRPHSPEPAQHLEMVSSADRVSVIRTGGGWERSELPTIMLRETAPVPESVLGGDVTDGKRRHGGVHEFSPYLMKSENSGIGERSHRHVRRKCLLDGSLRNLDQVRDLRAAIRRRVAAQKMISAYLVPVEALGTKSFLVGNHAAPLQGNFCCDAVCQCPPGP